MSRSEKNWIALGLLAHDITLDTGGTLSPAADYIVRLILRIENYPHILQAYGQAAADAALAWLQRCVQERFSSDITDYGHSWPISIAPAGGGTLAVTIRQLAALEVAAFGHGAGGRGMDGRGEDGADEDDGPCTIDDTCCSVVEWLCFTVSSLPVALPLARTTTRVTARAVAKAAGRKPSSKKASPDVAKVHLVLTGSWALPGEIAVDDYDVALRDPDHALPHILDASQGVRRTTGWAAHYRADMAVAARVLAAMETPPIGATPVGAVPPRASSAHSAHPAHSIPERLVLEWRPVCDALTPDRPLYYEVRPCLLDARGGVRDLGEACQALERVGLAYLLDRHILSQTVDELEACPGVRLGVTLHARSLRSAMWWSAAHDRLASHGPIARRLILTLADLGQARSMETRVLHRDMPANPVETAVQALIAPYVATPGLACVELFVQAMSDLGCVLAVDDAGMGAVSAEELQALAPDIIRVGDFFFSATDEQAAPAHTPDATDTPDTTDTTDAAPDDWPATPAWPRMAGGYDARRAGKPVSPWRCLGWCGAGGDPVLAAWQAMAALDSGRVGQAYDDASPAFKQMLSRKAFLRAIVAMREKYGCVSYEKRTKHPQHRSILL